MVLLIVFGLWRLVLLDIELVCVVVSDAFRYLFMLLSRFLYVAAGACFEDEIWIVDRRITVFFTFLNCCQIHGTFWLMRMSSVVSF